MKAHAAALISVMRFKLDISSFPSFAARPTWPGFLVNPCKFNTTLKARVPGELGD